MPAGGGLVSRLRRPPSRRASLLSWWGRLPAVGPSRALALSGPGGVPDAAPDRRPSAGAEDIGEVRGYRHRGDLSAGGLHRQRPSSRAAPRPWMSPLQGGAAGSGAGGCPSSALATRDLVVRVRAVRAWGSRRAGRGARGRGAACGVAIALPAGGAAHRRLGGLGRVAAVAIRRSLLVGFCWRSAARPPYSRPGQLQARPVVGCCRAGECRRS